MTLRSSPRRAAPAPQVRRIKRRSGRADEPRTVHEVSCVPWTDPEVHHWTISIEWRGNGLWAVTHSGTCLSVDGEWTTEPRSSDRTTAWITAHRFELSDALRVAKKQAPRIKINGLTAAGLRARREAQGR